MTARRATLESQQPQDAPPVDGVERQMLDLAKQIRMLAKRLTQLEQTFAMRFDRLEARVTQLESNQVSGSMLCWV